MTTTIFLMLLAGFATLSSLVTEAIKKLTTPDGRSLNLITLITALIVGGVGTLVYYQFNGIPFTVNNVICAVLMGLASGLTAMVGYDKVKEAIEQLIPGKSPEDE